jgi:hypothetical protein
MEPPRINVRDIALFERATPFRKPFRFGAVTVEGAAQAFVRVEIVLENGPAALGGTAELMVPKWFDKNPALSPADTVDALRRSLVAARALYLEPRAPLTAFALHAACIAGQIARCGAENIPPLAAAFGAAQIDKAILDALLRAHRLDLFRGLGANIAGLDARLTPDIDDGAIRHFLVSRRPPDRVALRHTVGMLDRLDGSGGLAGIAAETGCRFFKIKLGGDPAADIARLAAIDAELAKAGMDYRVTLDANEQYAGIGPLGALCHALDSEPELVGLKGRLLYIEQPLPREIALERPLGALAERFAVIIDEADDSYDAFPKAKNAGYAGISSKACKGIYKSLLNGARAMAWNAQNRARRYFVSAEDLTCQPGLALQQDTALVAFHGIAHAERNGHHYGDDFAGAPAAEQAAFAAAHPDLYRADADRVRLHIEEGGISARSLAVPGFASAVMPDWAAMQPLAIGAAA